MTDPIRKISKRKVLYVELDEEIPSLFARIAPLPYPDVFLVVPRRAVLFQSVVNLSILKKKAEGAGKSVSIITSDAVGMKLAHQAGIAVYDEVDHSDEPPQKIDEPAENLFSHVPIAAASNEVADNRPQRLKQKKLSIFEVVRSANPVKRFSIDALWERWVAHRKNRDLNKPTSKWALGAPSGKTLGTLVAGSLFLLIVISYVALPGATVTVVPQSNVVEQSTNIILANASRYGTRPTLETNGHVLAYFPIEATIEHSLTYTSTGEIFDGTHARGAVTLFNERSTSWPLVAFTRLQTEDGLVFRTQEAVTVPAVGPDGPGSVQVSVLSDEVDAYGRVIGSRGNIPPSSFFLPGLREESRKTLYARSSVAFEGGTSVVTLKVTKEDLEAARVLVESRMREGLEQSLKEEVARRNELNGTHLELLIGRGATKSDEPNIVVPDYLAETLQDSFSVQGKLKVYGVAYDRTEFEAVLGEELQRRKSPEKTLVKVEGDSISYEIFELEKTPGQIKLTATIQGIEAYAFDPSDENGARLIKKIKEHIAGKSIKEAEDYVQNLPEINKVTVSSWPVWAPTIPTVFDNIEIKVEGLPAPETK